MQNRKEHDLAIVAVVTVLLVTTAISNTTAEVFAGKYENDQAASQADACGNDEIPTNVGCQNKGSQIQGDENGVAMTAQQTFSEVLPISDGKGNGVGNGPTNPCAATGSVLVTDLEISNTLPILGTNNLGPVTMCIFIAGETPLVNLMDGRIQVSIQSTEISEGAPCDGTVVQADLDGTTLLLCVQLKVLDADADLPGGLEDRIPGLPSPAL